MNGRMYMVDLRLANLARVSTRCSCRYQEMYQCMPELSSPVLGKLHDWRWKKVRNFENCSGATSPAVITRADARGLPCYAKRLIKAPLSWREFFPANLLVKVSW